MNAGHGLMPLRDGYDFDLLCWASQHFNRAKIVECFKARKDKCSHRSHSNFSSFSAMVSVDDPWHKRQHASFLRHFTRETI